MNTTPTRAFGATGAHSPLAPLTIPRRAPGPSDVDIEVLYCGICHSDLHSVRDEWNAFMPTVYPIVPGHEIVGRVTRVGERVTKFKAGDLAAVGCLVDSDRTCGECRDGLEQFAAGGPLAEPDGRTLCSHEAAGYTDSPPIPAR